MKSVNAQLMQKVTILSTILSIMVAVTAYYLRVAVRKSACSEGTVKSKVYIGVCNVVLVN